MRRYHSGNRCHRRRTHEDRTAILRSLAEYRAPFSPKERPKEAEADGTPCVPGAWSGRMNPRRKCSGHPMPIPWRIVLGFTASVALFMSVAALSARAREEPTPQPDVVELLRATSHSQDPDLFSSWNSRLEQMEMPSRPGARHPASFGASSSGEQEGALRRPEKNNIADKVTHAGPTFLGWWLLPLALLVGGLGGWLGARFSYRRLRDPPARAGAAPPPHNLRHARILTVSSIPNHGLLVVLDVDGEELALWRGEGEHDITLLTRGKPVGTASSTSRRSANAVHSGGERETERLPPSEEGSRLHEAREREEGSWTGQGIAPVSANRASSSQKTTKPMHARDANNLTDEELDSLLTDLMDKVRDLKPLSRPANEV